MTARTRSRRPLTSTTATCRNIRCSGSGTSARLTRNNNFRAILRATFPIKSGGPSMPSKNRPYEQFGSFILFKKLESDALGDLWRAGRIDGTQLGRVATLRRLTGGKREAFVAAANEARALAPLLTGTTFAKEQVIDVMNGTPFIAHEYGGGRSLRHIVDRARGANGTTPNPIPLDQTIVI